MTEHFRESLSAGFYILPWTATVPPELRLHVQCFTIKPTANAKHTSHSLLTWRPLRNLLITRIILTHIETVLPVASIISSMFTTPLTVRPSGLMPVSVSGTSAHPLVLPHSQSCLICLSSFTYKMLMFPCMTFHSFLVLPALPGKSYTKGRGTEPISCDSQFFITNLDLFLRSSPLFNSSYWSIFLPPFPSGTSNTTCPNLSLLSPL